MKKVAIVLDRKSEIAAIFKRSSPDLYLLVENLIDDAVFLEKQLSVLKKLPLIRIHSKDPARQQVTPAGRLYKEYSARYTDIIAKLGSMLMKNEVTEESPLQQYFRERKEADK